MARSPPFCPNTLHAMLYLTAPVAETSAFLPSHTLTKFLPVKRNILCMFCSLYPFFFYPLAHLHSYFRPHSKCQVLRPLTRPKPPCTAPSCNTCQDCTFPFRLLNVSWTTNPPNAISSTRAGTSLIYLPLHPQCPAWCLASEVPGISNYTGRESSFYSQTAWVQISPWLLADMRS